MNDKRPVNLDIGSIKLPITAYVSILHRISGVAIFFGVGILLWLLQMSLGSAEGFANAKDIVDGFFMKLILWLIAVGFIYHSVAGTKHLIMDLGFGESMEGGIRGAKITLGVSIFLSLVTGLWVISW